MYSVRMDQSIACELVKRGGTLVFLDAPEGTSIGIDQTSFLIGPKFKGVKMVPSGVHAVSYAAHGKDESLAFGPKTAFFLDIQMGEIAAWRWIPSEEFFSQIMDDEELRVIHQAVKSFEWDQFLAPYNLSSYYMWKRLSCHISSSVLDVVAPVTGNISLLAEPIPGPVQGAIEDLNIVEKRERNEEQRSVSLTAPHAGRCFYTNLPRLIKQKGVTAADLTAINLDKSSALNDIITEKFKNKEALFLGEFQFAFLAFLLGESWESFEQWKSFLLLMFDCKEVCSIHGSRQEVFAQFLDALNAQLELSIGGLRCGDTPESSLPLTGLLDIEDLLKDSNVHKLCIRWLQWALHEEVNYIPTGVVTSAKSLAKTLQDRFGLTSVPFSELRAERGASTVGSQTNSNEEEELKDKTKLHDTSQWYDDFSDSEDEGPLVVELTDSQRQYLEESSQS